MYTNKTQDLQPPQRQSEKEKEPWKREPPVREHEREEEVKEELCSQLG